MNLYSSKKDKKMKKLLLTSLLFAGLMGTGSMFAMEGEAPTSAEFETSVEDAKTELDNQEAKQAELESQRDELEQREKDESLTEEERKEAREELEATKKSLADSKVQTDKASRDIETAKSEGNTSEGREALDRANTALKADEALTSMESDLESTDDELSKKEIADLRKELSREPEYTSKDLYGEHIGKVLDIFENLDKKLKSIVSDTKAKIGEIVNALNDFGRDLKNAFDSMQDRGTVLSEKAKNAINERWKSLKTVIENLPSIKAKISFDGNPDADSNYKALFGDDEGAPNRPNAGSSNTGNNSI
ncbi:hypothetical protein HOK96_02375 [bacterium]|nr:hypothetical protein [bacterium]